MKRRRAVIAAAAVAAALLAACGDPGDSGGAGESATGPIKIGYLTSLTGPNAAAAAHARLGGEARVKMVNDAGGINGRPIELVVADDVSTAEGALTAVRSLVENEGVFGIVNASPFLFSAYRYLTQNGVPVTGGGWDGPGWQDPKATNMFSYNGTELPDYPPNTVEGEFIRLKGGRVVGTLGYAQSPSSTASARGTARSAEAAGLSAPYVNTSIPFGSVDFGSIALAMKDAGVDSVALPIVSNSSIAFLAAAKQVGLDLKVVVISQGYGQALLDSPQSVAAAEGAYFTTSGLKPVELNDEATRRLTESLAAVGYSGVPEFGVYTGWAATDLMITGLEKTGNTDREAFIETLRATTDYAGSGLIVKPIDLSVVPSDAPPSGCVYYVRLESGKFVPDEAASPICGKPIL